jgi:aminoglycoside phosphotransferase (APT) family kinase protein
MARLVPDASDPRDGAGWLVVVEWDERRRFNASDPPAGGLALMARELAGRRAIVVDVRRLAGGVDAATHAVRLEPGGWLVLKRVPAARAASLVREADRLRFAQRAPVATPEPVALDAEGAWFGHPALVMGLVPGASELHPATGSWIDDLAATLAAVHSTSLDGEIPPVLRAPHAGIAWQPGPPDELPRTTRVQALVDIGLSLAADPAPEGAGGVLLHHDFHYGNVLWQADRASGVVDWNEARIGPALCDVGYCAVDLATTHGRAASERFTAAYATAAGTDLDGLDRWLCLWIANALRWIDLRIAGFREAGIAVSRPLVRRRLTDLADHTLAHL